MKIKRKGAYEYDREWHQDHSALVVAKAAEAAMVNKEDIREFIENHEDVFDFFLRAKATGGAYLEWGGEPFGKILRYYVSTDGDYLDKVMPPKGPVGQHKKANGVSETEYIEWHMVHGNEWNPDIHTKNKSTHEERRVQVHQGWTVQPCNNLEGHSFSDLNYEWYINEAEKLVIR